MRYLLALLIFALTIIDIFGWSASLGPGLSVKNAILYMILLGLAARFVQHGGIRLELPQVHAWFGILIACATLSWLFTAIIIRYRFYTVVGSGIELKNFLLDNVLVFGVYLYGARNYSDAKFLLKCLLLAIAVANAVAIGDVAGLIDIGTTKVGETGNLAGRLFGAFGHANETAALVVCLLPAYIAATLSSAGVERWMWGLAGAGSAAAMVMTGSRGAFVGVALGLVFGLYICRSIISWRRVVTVAAPLAAVAVLVLVLASVEFGDILTSRVTEMLLNPGSSSGDRVAIWIPVVSKMLATPITLITGFGWGAFEVMGFFYGTHNHYLWLWFELGIVGLGSYLMLIGELVITARRAAQTASDEAARYLIAFIFGMIALSGALIFAQIFKPWLYIWIYVGVTMRMAVSATQPARANALNEQRGAPGIRSAAATVRRAGAAPGSSSARPLKPAGRGSSSLPR
ncbi:MAG: O-antigen ligase family protein [Steroidobacteraceae bacterium]